MIIENRGEIIRYVASTGDWIIDASSQGLEILLTLINNTQSFDFSSGINLDNLATFITEVKSDCIAKGYNWPGN